MVSVPEMVWHSELVEVAFLLRFLLTLLWIQLFFIALIAIATVIAAILPVWLNDSSDKLR